MIKIPEIIEAQNIHTKDKRKFLFHREETEQKQEHTVQSIINLVI